MVDGLAAGLSAVVGDAARVLTAPAVVDRLSHDLFADGGGDGEEVLGVALGVDLAAAGVEALEVDGVAGGDAKTRRKIAIPHGVRGFGEEGVGGHGSCSLTVI